MTKDSVSKDQDKKVTKETYICYQSLNVQIFDDLTDYTQLNM